MVTLEQKLKSFTKTLGNLAEKLKEIKGSLEKEQTEEEFLRGLGKIEIKGGPDIKKMALLRKTVLKTMGEKGQGLVVLPRAIVRQDASQ